MGERAAKGLLDLADHGHVRVMRVRAPEVYRADIIERLGQEVRRAIEAAGAEGSFVLDLSDVLFLTSAAVGLVTNIRAHLEARGYPFAVAGARGEVARVIETIRLAEIMPVFPTVEETLQAFRCK
jgi:anti-anti-sigma factor